MEEKNTILKELSLGNRSRVDFASRAMVAPAALFSGAGEFDFCFFFSLLQKTEAYYFRWEVELVTSFKTLAPLISQRCLSKKTDKHRFPPDGLDLSDTVKIIE